MNTIYINGKGTDGLIHVAHPTERFKTLCGWEPPLDQRWYTQSSDTPTCPKCVAMTEHDTDTTQAVIEAARAVMKHVHVKEAWGRLGSQVVDVAAKEGSHTLMAQYYAADPFPDTLLGTLAGLVAALEAHDEATIESEDA